MRLTIARHLWGVATADAAFYDKTAASGLYGAIETPILRMDANAKAALTDALQRHQWQLITQAFTGGNTVQEHVDSFKKLADEAVAFGCALINFHSGRDAFNAAETREFYRQVLAYEQQLPVPVAHETHRGRVFYSPWTTKPVLDEFPQLKLTADFSHWVCVAERIIDDQIDIITQVAERTVHIHARVGYGEGPQVPDPRAPEYAAEVAAHERWWDLVWESMQRRGLAVATLTPEFGPPAYLHTLPHTNVPVADLAQIVDWQATRQAARFAARGMSAAAAG